jgi:hypothetical protein
MKQRRSRSSGINLELACLSVKKPFADVEAMNAVRWVSFVTEAMSPPSRSQNLLSNEIASAPEQREQFVPFDRRISMLLHGLAASSGWR